MAFATGQASGYSHLLELLKRFITGNPHETARVYAQGTATVAGNGALSNFLVDASATPQTWTIACVTGGTTGLFTVTGSSHGAAGTATVGTGYSLTNEISFTLVTGTTAYAAGNTYTVTVGGAIGTADQWSVDRYTASDQLIAHGPGSGTDTIYVGIKLVSDTVGDYYNWKINGFTGFSSGNTFENQPGAFSETLTPVHVPLWNSELTYWFMATGRRIIVVAKISTVYEICYLGFVDPFASPGQYPYPLFIGGSLAWGNTTAPGTTDPAWRWSYTGNEHRHFWETIYGSVSSSAQPSINRGQARLRTQSGVWRDIWSGFGNNYDPSAISPGTTHRDAGSLATWIAGFATQAAHGGMWPSIAGITAQEACLDGSYLVMPLVVFLGSLSGDSPDIAGQLNGIGRVTGGVAAEDILTIGGTQWLVVPNVFRSNRSDYCAVQLA